MYSWMCDLQARIIVVLGHTSEQLCFCVCFVFLAHIRGQGEWGAHLFRNCGKWTLYANIDIGLYSIPKIYWELHYFSYDVFLDHGIHYNVKMLIYKMNL